MRNSTCDSRQNLQNVRTGGDDESLGDDVAGAAVAVDDLQVDHGIVQPVREPVARLRRQILRCWGIWMEGGRSKEG